MRKNNVETVIPRAGIDVDGERAVVVDDFLDLLDRDPAPVAVHGAVAARKLGLAILLDISACVARRHHPLDVLAGRAGEALA